MMVGVPVLFMVWVGACWPFVCVMAVGVGVCGFWWCVFQWCVAVVPASSVVPGVLACVGWLVLVGVCGLVCVVWFRMLTCSGLFLSFGFVSCLFCLVVWLITGCLVVWARVGVCLWGVWVGCVCLCAWAGACVLWMGESVFVCFLWVIGLLFVCWSRVVCVRGYWLLSCL